MLVISSISVLKDQIKKSRTGRVGLVPTMGALHEGHLSLVRNAALKCSLVVVSIYVNPAQFNDREDLKNYPRSPEKDLDLLRKVLREGDIVFTPDDKEIYPAEDKRVFDFGNAGNVMEALHRPGHFNGVGQIVSRLFDITGPDMAFFGQKDLQQVAVIKELVRQCRYKVRIIVNPVIREADGLAMSSRNILLDAGDRKKAPLIYKTISGAAKMIPQSDIPEIRDYVISTIREKTGFDVEYFEIADERNLVPVTSKKEMKKRRRYFGCIAIRAGKIRLIDNIEFPLP